MAVIFRLSGPTTTTIHHRIGKRFRITSTEPIMFYHFELQMAGVILLTAMAAGGISLWIKRRRDRIAEEL